MRRRTSLPQIESPEVTWLYNGIPHRVRLSPQGPRAISDEKVVFEWQPDGVWERFEPDPFSETFAEAALEIDDESWAAFTRELPPALQDFLRLFRFERLEALVVATQCPALLPHLEAAPALTLFVAAHVALRGTDGPRWTEIGAVFERGGLYGVLEWLGLPASPQATAVLAELSDPEIPRHQLPALRAELWAACRSHPLAA